MKKILCLLFIVLFSFFMSFNILANEAVVPDIGSYEYTKLQYLPDKKTFNYLKIMNDSYTRNKIQDYNRLLSSSSSNLNGTITFETTITFYSDEGEIANSKLDIIYRIRNSNIVQIFLDVGYARFIDSMIIANNITNCYFDVKNYNPSCVLAMIGEFQVYLDGFYQNMIIEPDLFIAMIYEYSESSDIYIPVNSDIDISDIINEIVIVDDSKNRIFPCQIVENNYVDSSTIGDYSIKLRGYNNENKAIFKWINIHVADLKDIVEEKNFVTSYANKLDDLSIISDLNIYKEYLSVKISSEYHYGFNRKGRYKYVANILLSDMNIFISGYIEVKDEDSPYAIKAPNIITASKDVCFTKDSLLRYFNIYDDHDGTIPNSSITLDGFIKYLSNYDIINDYPITLTAKDKTQNEYTHDFIIRVREESHSSVIERYRIPDYISPNNEGSSTVIEEVKEEKNNPIISNSDYVIRAYTTHKLTASEVQDILISDGYLNNSDVVYIDSDYFRESNPKAGNFSLSVTYENGDVTYYEINLTEKETDVVEKSYTGLIVSLIIGGIALISVVVIIIMRVYVHVKKN